MYILMQNVLKNVQDVSCKIVLKYGYKDCLACHVKCTVSFKQCIQKVQKIAYVKVHRAGNIKQLGRQLCHVS
jgi:hypothetical protein